MRWTSGGSWVWSLEAIMRIIWDLVTVLLLFSREALQSKYLWWEKKCFGPYMMYLSRKSSVHFGDYLDHWVPKRRKRIIQLLNRKHFNSSIFWTFQAWITNYLLPSYDPMAPDGPPLGTLPGWLLPPSFACWLLVHPTPSTSAFRLLEYLSGLPSL